MLTIYKALGLILVVFAFSTLIFGMNPEIWHMVNNDNTIRAEGNTLLQTVKAQTKLDELKTVKAEEGSHFRFAEQLPAKNLNLTTEYTLRIDKIGVNATINAGNDGLKQLEKGVWNQSGATPIDPEAIILASHRYGLLSWDNEFRKQNSFYDLPKLSQGDTVTLIHDQREFSYKVKSKFVEVGEVEVDADLVLYTCEFLNTDKRIIVLADRM